MTKRIVASFSLLLAALLVLTSCSSKTKATEANDTVKDTLGQTFLEELWNDILPFREQPAALPALGVMVRQEDLTTKGGELFDEFYMAYETGRPAQLTAALYGKSSLVIVRFDVTADGQGYYYRYSYTDTNEPLSVTSKVFTKLEMSFEEGNAPLGVIVPSNNSITKATLDAWENKDNYANFTFYLLEEVE